MLPLHTKSYSHLGRANELKSRTQQTEAARSGPKTSAVINTMVFQIMKWSKSQVRSLIKRITTWSRPPTSAIWSKSASAKEFCWVISWVPRGRSRRSRRRSYASRSASRPWPSSLAKLWPATPTCSTAEPSMAHALVPTMIISNDQSKSLK